MSANLFCLVEDLVIAVNSIEEEIVLDPIEDSMDLEQDSIYRESFGRPVANSCAKCGAPMIGVIDRLCANPGCWR